MGARPSPELAAAAPFPPAFPSLLPRPQSLPHQTDFSFCSLNPRDQQTPHKKKKQIKARDHLPPGHLLGCGPNHH